jgi:hypothetical protein
MARCGEDDREMSGDIRLPPPPLDVMTQWRPQIRFTLGQLAILIACCAFALALFRMPGGLLVLNLTGLVVPGFILGRTKGRTGIGGGMLSGCLTFASFGLIVDFGFVGNPLLFVLAFPVAGMLWGAAVSIAVHVVIKNWKRLDCDRRPAPSG